MLLLVLFYIEINYRIVSYSNIYHKNIYRYIFTIFLKKYQKLSQLRLILKKDILFLRVLNVRLEILKKNLHSKTF